MERPDDAAPVKDLANLEIDMPDEMENDTDSSFEMIENDEESAEKKILSFLTKDSDEWRNFIKTVADSKGDEPNETRGYVDELRLPLDLVDDDADQDVFVKLGKLLPNLKKIEMPANFKVANVVYKSMPTLQEVVFSTKNVEIIDDILTGLSAQDCQQIRDKFTENMFKRLKLIEDSPRVGVNRPISYLKNLKVLRLRAEDDTRPIEITKVSCMLVLMKMKSLEMIDFGLRRPEVVKEAENVLDDLKKKFVVITE